MDTSPVEVHIVQPSEHLDLDDKMYINVKFTNNDRALSWHVVACFNPHYQLQRFITAHGWYRKTDGKWEPVGRPTYLYFLGGSPIAEFTLQPGEVNTDYYYKFETDNALSGELLVFQVTADIRPGTGHILVNSNYIEVEVKETH